jgi:hypothetical protein
MGQSWYPNCLKTHILKPFFDIHIVDRQIDKASQKMYVSNIVHPIQVDAICSSVSDQDGISPKLACCLSGGKTRYNLNSFAMTFSR